MIICQPTWPLRDLDLFYFIFLFYVTLKGQGHIATGSLLVEELVHTSWSRFCSVIHRALAIQVLPTLQHEAPGPRFKLATTEVEGKHSNRRAPH